MSIASIQSSDELRDLYRELILDHSRKPRHFGKLANATHTAEGINPLCGDKLQVYLQLDTADVIESASFEGSGCAISVASASLMTEIVIGRSRESALDYFAAITAHLTAVKPGKSASVDLEKIRALDGVREFPARVKCATLAWHALHSAIKQQAGPVTTE